MPKQSTFKKGTKPYKALRKTKSGQAKLRVRKKPVKVAGKRKRPAKKMFSKKFETYKQWAMQWKGIEKSKHYLKLKRRHERHPDWSLNRLTGHGWKDLSPTLHWKRSYKSGRLRLYYDYFMEFILYFHLPPNTPPTDKVWVDKVTDTDIETFKYKKKMVINERKVKAFLFATHPSYIHVGRFTGEDFARNFEAHIQQSIHEIKMKYHPLMIEIREIFRHYKAMDIEKDSQIGQALA